MYTPPAKRQRTGYAKMLENFSALTFSTVPCPPSLTESLLAALHSIEARFARERPYPNAPRTLDLDLLLFGQRRIATPTLTLPHPRMHQRAFVLLPLAELAPELVAEIPAGQRVEKLAP